MTDLATPLTYWRNARSWRGAFEGWLPTTDNFMHHVPKTLPGLDGFYMAGQWVEPGGGVPTALMSGRQLAQILCDAAGRTFTPTG
jgi:phytoene dehydrogenase-like protein